MLSTSKRLPDSAAWPPALGGFRGQVLRFCLAAGLLYCVHLEVRQGLAAWYLRQDSFRSLDAALRWEPADPGIQNRFGTTLHLYGAGPRPDEVVEFYRRAVDLSSQNARYWADLGAAYDWAGRSLEAAGALRRAEERFPNSPDIQWRIANFAVRQGNTGEALQALRKALRSGGIRSDEIFLLANRATKNQNRILNDLVPPQADGLLDYLRFLIARGDLSGAHMVWRRLLEANVPFAVRDAFPYLDALIERHNTAEVRRTWSDLANRFPGQISPPDPNGNLVLNGSFERQPLDGGLDWRILPLGGVHVTREPGMGIDGAPSLRIDFAGTGNPYYCHVFQYVPVAPETAYHFSGALRARDITSDSGASFEIYDAADMNRLFLTAGGVTGNSGWELQQLRFKTKAETRFLVVRVARRPSEKIANRISGTVWISAIRLEADRGPDAPVRGTHDLPAAARR